MYFTMYFLLSDFFYRNDCVCKVLSNLVHNRYLYMQVFYNVIFSQ